MLSPENNRILPPELKEKCGVFGTFYPQIDSSPYTELGLVGLQHRGQESAGIVSSDGGKKLAAQRGDGLVYQVFPGNYDYGNLPGGISIGHTKYGTSRVMDGANCHLQPVVGKLGKFALSHNGNLPDTTALYDFFEQKGIPNPGYNDSEMMHAGIEYYIRKGAPLEEAIEKASPLFTGAWSLVMMDKEKLVAARDPKGIRPLSIGKGHDGYAFSSETCAFKPLDINPIRDVAPGEMIIVDHNGMRSVELAKGEQHLDVFEFVYFAKPDSYLLGQNVEIVRERMGKIAATEMLNWDKPIKADVVIGTPASGSSAARGFANESGIPIAEGAIVKNNFALRTFQKPEVKENTNNTRSNRTKEISERAKSIMMKLSIIPEKVKDLRVIVMDDSIVRGNTYRIVGELLRDAGAREVHMISSSPEVYYPDFYGIDTPEQGKLFANIHKTPEERRIALSADSLHYLSYKGMIEAIGVPEEMLSTSAFSGNYPVDIGKRAQEVERVNRR